MKVRFLLTLCFFIMSCESKQKVEYLQTDEHAALGRPFSEAVQVGNMLYLSGKIGPIPPDTTPSPGILPILPER
jgi:enamine deaminase RidA (YjgF/YER057c/UK114 family)